MVDRGNVGGGCPQRPSQCELPAAVKAGLNRTRGSGLHERGDLGGWLIKTVHRAWGALGGYGYRTGRIALALLISLLAAAVTLTPPAAVAKQ
jgi:hypothetical protein